MHGSAEFNLGWVIISSFPIFISHLFTLSIDLELNELKESVSMYFSNRRLCLVLFNDQMKALFLIFNIMKSILGPVYA
jgi:hypothetical protein